MKLTVNGELSSYYVQTLLLLWFPGEKFPENSEGEKVFFEISAGAENGEAWARARICGEGKCESAEARQGRIEDYPVSEDRLVKLAAGRAVWDCAGRYTGNKSPWGILTGVRPAKVASEIFSYGADEKRAVQLLRDLYLVSPGKAALCTGVSLAEGALVTPQSRRTCSVYIAIPFCPSRCAYCSFVSFTSPGLLKLIPEYLTALAGDIEFIFGEIERYGLSVSDIYVGGGTPTVLSTQQLDFLLSVIGKGAAGHNISEFTVEAGRPDTITEEKLACLASHGVSRISVNTQTLNDGILRAIGRAHTAGDFFRAYETAVSSGIPDINVDLIAGLPGESAESSVESARRVAALRPSNLTVHSFSVKKSSYLKSEGVYDSVGEEAARAVDGMHSIAYGGGYRPYYMYRQKNTVGNLENVGFSLPGHECMYNIYMMEEIHTVFAAGASSVTKLVKHGENAADIRRIFEAKYPYEYLRAHSPEMIGERRRAFRETEEEFFGK